MIRELNTRAAPKVLLDDGVNECMIAVIRLLLALAALIITILDPAEPDYNAPFTYAALICYVLYSAAIYVVGSRLSSGNAMRLFGRWPFGTWTHWADIAWFTLFIALSNGTQSLFFFFYIFAIVVAALRWGFGPGLRASIVSAFLFSFVGYFTTSSGPEFKLNLFLLRPTYLLLIGYMIAWLGGYDVALRRRLSLLKDISSLSNPRFGIDRTLGALAERLRDFYNADQCVMVITEWHQIEPHLRRARRGEPEATMRTYPLTIPMRRKLMALPDIQTIWYRHAPNAKKAVPGLRVFDVITGETTTQNVVPAEGMLEELVTTLDAEAFLSTPLCHRGTAIGRVFIVGPGQGVNDSDLKFLVQAIEHVMPSLDNMLLLDRLASDAAEEERQRIARDLHDSIIQPYIGLRIGLAALCGTLNKDKESVENDVRRLINLADAGIEELRNYVAGLKAAGQANTDLRAAIQRMISRFSDASTIQVQLEVDAGLRLNDRLAAELLQMIAEGLSNIRRHTNADRACIQLESHNGNLDLHIVNEAAPGQVMFTPRSLSGRAAALGGVAEVEYDGEHTVIHIQIPL